MLGVSDLDCWQNLSLNKISLNSSPHSDNLGLEFLPYKSYQTASLKENSEGSTYCRIQNSRVTNNNLPLMPVKNNIRIANTHKRLTVTKVLKYFLNKGDQLAIESKLF